MLNHAQVDQVLGDSGRVTGVAVTDTLTGTMHRVRARAVVNAAGPWVDEVLQGGRATERRPLMGGTKGTHIVVDPFPGAPVGVALYYEAVTDARPMMVIPWLGQYLIGATDVRFTGDLNAATNDRDEIDYILRETNLVLPHAGLTTREVRWAWTGVRPLPYHPSGPTGDITRRHLVKRHESDADLRLAGLYSVIGGKLTTFRSVAVDTVNTVIRDAGLGRRHNRPLRRLPGAQVADFSRFRSSYLAGSASPSEVRHRLVNLYGTRALQVEALAEQRPELQRAVGETPGLTAAEVLFVAERESAATVSDVVARRILTGLGNDFGLKDVDAVAEVLIRHARWNEDAVAEQVAAYGRYVRRFEMRAAPA